MDAILDHFVANGRFLALFVSPCFPLRGRKLGSGVSGLEIATSREYHEMSD